MRQTPSVFKVKNMSPCFRETAGLCDKYISLWFSSVLCRTMLPQMIQQLPSNARSLWVSSSLALFSRRCFFDFFCSYWLDGHFSGSKFETSRVDIDSPVISELHTVLSRASNENTVIAIDDARMFLGNGNCRFFLSDVHFVHHFSFDSQWSFQQRMLSKNFSGCSCRLCSQTQLEHSN